ncbi:MAG: ABC-2 family transporter protein [Patescibacteria group bacterium]
MEDKLSFLKYFKLWWMMTFMVSQNAFVSRFGAILFVFGKLIRFSFFLFFLLIIASRTNAIVGYTIWQIILFYLTFNIIDSLAQFFLREVYRFRNYVVSGDFDYFLTKPMPALFRLLFGGSDILDIPILLLSSVFIYVALSHIGPLTILNILIYLGLLINGFVIMLSFHILVLAIGVITTEVDNTLWLFRDITQMGRFPIDIYQNPLRSFITFVIPVGVMVTFPAKAAMGLLSFNSVLISVGIGAAFLYLSIMFWRFSLKKYSSASS